MSPRDPESSWLVNDSEEELNEASDNLIDLEEAELEDVFGEKVRGSSPCSEK